MGGSAAKLLIHQNDKVYKYEYFSILFSFHHIQAHPQIARGIRMVGKFNCTYVCVVETIVCGLWCVINIHFSEFKGQATEKYTILIGALELNPAAELHRLLTVFQ